MINENVLISQERLFKPVLALIDESSVKLFITSLSGLALMLLEHLGIILATKGVLVTALLVLVTIDFVTGVWAAKRRGETITSAGFRATGIKLVEYIFVLLSVTILSNLTSELNWIQTWAYIFVCTTEVKSIGENLPRIGGFFTQLFTLLNTKNNINVTK